MVERPEEDGPLLCGGVAGVGVRAVGHRVAGDVVEQPAQTRALNGLISCFSKYNFQMNSRILFLKTLFKNVRPPQGAKGQTMPSARSRKPTATTTTEYWGFNSMISGREEKGKVGQFREEDGARSQKLHVAYLDNVHSSRAND